MKRIAYFVLTLFFTHSFLSAQNVGDPAPDFTHSTSDNNSLTLSDYRGKVVYMFFFGWN